MSLTTNRRSHSHSHSHSHSQQSYISTLHIAISRLHRASMLIRLTINHRAWLFCRPFRQATTRQRRASILILHSNISHHNQLYTVISQGVSRHTTEWCALKLSDVLSRRQCNFNMLLLFNNKICLRLRSSSL
jgi:hypothetical protein